MWEHRQSNHPDKIPEFPSRTPKDMILSLIAEQNIDLIEEVETFRKDVTNSMVEFAYRMEACFLAVGQDIKESAKNTHEVFHDALTSLNEKMSDVENPAKPDLKVTTADSTPGSPKLNSEAASSCSVPPPLKQSAKKSSLTKKARVAWVGTSLSKQLNKSKFENDLKVDLNIEHAYCIVNETDAHFPEKNFRAVVPKVIGNDDINTLVLQADSIEITNFDVNKAVKDPKKKIDDYKKQWFEKVEKDSSNLFDIAEDALKNSTSLQKVIIVKGLTQKK